MNEPPQSEASKIRDVYLDFADNMEPPPQSRYARALGAMSADYQGCLADLKMALAHLEASGWKHTEEIKLCKLFLLRALNSHNPAKVELPLIRNPAA
jgi:hypothetical protein